MLPSGRERKCSKEKGDDSFSGGNRFALFEASKFLVGLTGAFRAAKARELAQKCWGPHFLRLCISPEILRGCESVNQM